jgi:hypothetical protein
LSVLLGLAFFFIVLVIFTLITLKLVIINDVKLPEVWISLFILVLAPRPISYRIAGVLFASQQVPQCLIKIATAIPG